MIREVHGTCIYGDPGTGKSYATMDILKNQVDAGGRVFKPRLAQQSGGKQWYDGYDGEEALWIDEYADNWSVAYLKTILDVYQLSVEAKNGHHWAKWK